MLPYTLKKLQVGHCEAEQGLWPYYTEESHLDMHSHDTHDTHPGLHSRNAQRGPIQEPQCTEQTDLETA